MRITPWPVFRAIAPLLLLLPALNTAQSQSPSAASKTTSVKFQINPQLNSPTSDRDLADLREQLLTLLRMSPTLTEVIASDPTLLANQDYVTRNNPELEKFLQNHPEVVRNPDFYLFANLPSGPGRRSERLMRKTWMDQVHNQQDNGASAELVRAVGPFLVLLTILAALIWLIRILLENRRWGRIFKMQTEVHGKLIERFGNNEELLSYMNTEAGRRFLEAAPIPIGFEPDRRVPAALSRVLVPLQIGVVLTLLGIGLLILRHSLREISSPLLVFGIVVLMPGLGFIISAGITWLLAARLGLMPHAAHELQALSDSGDRHP
ncbi:MAG TPA: hypothetical protein VK684_10585 [Edaphobacter sp.]|nr:hypothetical protein [Edaphobacter sp.]